jgi:hypothetical protein
MQLHHHTQGTTGCNNKPKRSLASFFDLIPDRVQFEWRPKRSSDGPGTRNTDFADIFEPLIQPIPLLA